MPETYPSGHRPGEQGQLANAGKPFSQSQSSDPNDPNFNPVLPEAPPKGTTSSTQAASNQPTDGGQAPPRKDATLTGHDVAPRPTQTPATQPSPDGGVSIQQQYSIAVSASRDELMNLHTLLQEADKKVLSILERFSQG